MKLSTRVRYGIRAVLELAENYGRGPIQTRIIAANQDISVKYLEQLLATLRSAGIVRSLRGARGGYVLAKPPNEIMLSDVFVAFEGTVATVECVISRDYCGRSADCMARQIWLEVQQAIMNVLESKTLQDMVEQTQQRKSSNYQI